MATENVIHKLEQIKSKKKKQWIRVYTNNLEQILPFKYFLEIKQRLVTQANSAM